MTVKVISGSPASGKTQWLIDQIQHEKKNDGLRKIRVILPDQRHKKTFQQRLIGEGGMLGVYIGLFNEFCRELLLDSGYFFPRASLPLRHRVLLESIQTVHTQKGLGEFTTLKDMPGFISLLHDQLSELQQAGVDPFDPELDSWRAANSQVSILLDIYQEYFRTLQKLDWLDENNIIQFTYKSCLQPGNNKIHYDLLILDGFERFTPPQIKIISWMDQQSMPVFISLPLDEHSERLVYQRAAQTLQTLRSHIPNLEVLQTNPSGSIGNPLLELAEHFFQPGNQPVKSDHKIHLLEVQSPSHEVRESLRWLKKKLLVVTQAEENIFGGGKVNCAVVVPNLELYQPIIKTVAEEYGLSVNFSQSEILGIQPAIHILTDLLKLHSQNYPRRLLIDIIRSPYFDTKTLGFLPGDAITLEMVSRYGVIVSSLEKWREVLGFLAANRIDENRMEDLNEGESISFNLPYDADAERLLAGIHQFSEIILPPEGHLLISEWLDWFEILLVKINWISKVAEADQHELIEDLFKTLHGLRVAEIEMGKWVLSYDQFVKELESLLNLALVQNRPVYEDAIQVLRIPEVRGHRFEYVAALGLAEGSFPAVERADPFLPEEFRQHFGLELRLDRNQIGQMFQLMTRANFEFLLTRPYLTAKGEGLEASPYWNAIVEILGKESVRTLRPSEARSLVEAASLSELLYWVGQYRYDASLLEDENINYAWGIVKDQKQVLESRRRRNPDDHFDGLLRTLIHPINRMQRTETIWSASKLETYISCPMRFWVNYGLKIKEQQIPDLGLQAWQIGNILHAILEKAYKQAKNPADPNSVLEVLDFVAAEAFDLALAAFRIEKDVLWDYQQQEWTENLKEAIINLGNEEWEPYAQEQKFGLDNQPSLKIILSNGKVLQIHGVIDRVDRNAHGQIRVIDYKTGGSHLDKTDLINGTRLQLPLYALAARDALKLGQPVEGFYWAILAQKKSSLQLSRFEFEDFNGVEGAFEIARQHLENAMEGITKADFHPKKPVGGCPEYCPARLWCWRYSPEGW